MDKLQQVLSELFANAQEDWAEDKYYFSDPTIAPMQVQKVNEVLSELGPEVPAQYRGKVFVAAGVRLKIVEAGTAY